MRHAVEALRYGQGREDHVDNLDAGIEVISLHPGLHGPSGGHPAPEDLGGEVGERFLPVGTTHRGFIVGHAFLAQVEGLEGRALADLAEDALVELLVDAPNVKGQLERDLAVHKGEFVAQRPEMLDGCIVHEIYHGVEPVDGLVRCLMQLHELFPDGCGIDLEHVRVFCGPLHDLVDLLHLVGGQHEGSLEVVLQLDHLGPCRLGVGDT